MVKEKNDNKKQDVWDSLRGETKFSMVMVVRVRFDCIGELDRVTVTSPTEIGSFNPEVGNL